MMTFDSYVDALFEQAQYNIKQHIEMLCLQAECKLSLPSDKKGGIDKNLFSNLIEKYLKKRGYVLNTILGKPVWTKEFCCVYIEDNYVEAWHDLSGWKPHSLYTKRKGKSVFITEALLTGLPITLDYFEKI